MYTPKKREIDGHTVEIRYSGTGSMSSWESIYCRENKISVMCTCDISYFALVDGDTIYKLGWRSNEFMEKEFDDWNSALEWLESNSEREPYSLKERIKELSKYK